MANPARTRPASRSATCRHWRSTGDGERRYLDADTSGFRCTCLLQGLELHNKAFNGGGAVRQLAPGYVFQLIQLGRFAAGANRLTALAVDHTARNDLGKYEKEQLKAFAPFIKANKKLAKAIKEKEWLTFAINYN